MTDEGDEQAIRALIDDWTDAICKGDIDRVLANRTDDIVMYDVPEPIQEKGVDAYRQTWRLFFEQNPPGPDRFRLSDLHVVAGGDAAYAYGSSRSAAASPSAASPSVCAGSTARGK